MYKTSFIVFLLLCCLKMEGQFLPGDFGIKGNGKPVNEVQLYKWLEACKAHSKKISLPAGTFCLPVNFQFDFGDRDLVLTGQKGKTIITTWDSTAQTNFQLPGKLDLFKEKPGDGVYQIDITGLAPATGDIHKDFEELPNKKPGSYVLISNQKATNISFEAVKVLGYLTELNTQDPDPGIDGLYVVSRHRNFSYGGGFAHLNLKYSNDLSGELSHFNTGGKNLWYVQGSILQRKNGVWSQYYAGAGFCTTKNLTVKNIIFDNVRFYLFSPFDPSTKYRKSSSEKFSIDHCIFKNCSRIISSCSYAGVDHDATWFKMSQVYDYRRQFRFNDFSIKNSDFSYIHQSIVWGAPPSRNCLIRGNRIHDCYSILTSFFLLMGKDSSDYNQEKMKQIVQNNSFVNVRPLNPGANWNTNIIRTSGAATISNNQFINITQQVAYICGANSYFTNNKVEKFIDDDSAYFSSPVILSKMIMGPGKITITGNTIYAPLSNFVEMEGGASFIISNNTFIGYLKNRNITDASTSLDPRRIYFVQNLNSFRKLVSQDPGDARFDVSILQNDHVYFDKRTGTWKKLLAKFGGSYVFSKSDDFEEKRQVLFISGNHIESENISSVGSRKKHTSFKSVTLQKNQIICGSLHTGNNATVESYYCSQNKFHGTLNISTASSLTSQVKDLFFENNRVTVSNGGNARLWAYRKLLFSGNIISAEVEVTSEQKLLEGNLIILKGNPGSEIIAEKNHFAGRLSIENPFYVSIMNNRFVLDSNIIHSETAATYIEGNNIQSIIFSDNLITAPANRGNFLFQFDNTAGIIDSLTVGNNSMNGSKNPTPYYMKETQKIIRNFVHEPGETGSKDIKKGPG